MRWRTRRARPAGAVLAAVGVLLVSAGCGAAQPAGPAPEIRAVNAWGGDAAAEGPPKRGGTLQLGMDREIVSFDPTVQNANMATFAVYDSLMKLTPDGTAEPYLAQSMETPDAGLTWRMGLRPDVRFSDGTPLDADAVLVNVQRHVDKVSSPAHPYAEQIASMRAVDPLTVEFTLTSPLGSFPVLFGQSITYGSLGVIISPAALERYGDDIGRNPVGAGPFRFVEWVPDSRVVLERNPDYWQPDRPHLDRLEFRPLPDTESRYASIQNGDVDLIFAAYNQELVRAFQDPRLTVYYGPGNAGEYLYFNFARAPFDDRRMREAIIRSLDIDALSASLYGNQIVRSTSLFDASSPYHTEESSQEWPSYDPDRARQLIDEYRAGGGNPDFTLKTTTARVPFGEFVQAQMAAVGITVQLQFYDLAQYSSQVVQSGDFDLTTTVSMFDAPYPGASRLVRTGGNTNYGRYSQPDVDALLDTAASTSDEAERTQAYQEVERRINRDLVACWLSRGYLATIAEPAVKGIDRYVSRDMFYANLWLDR
jgi:ABC-type transport system substrate-binding protein